MTPSPEREALQSAVLENPDDDLPRLVFADWLDENGDPERARFIRAQIALATVAEWDPQAVALQRTRAEWDSSEAKARELPGLSFDRGVHWPERAPFRRGFASSIQAPMLRALQFEMPRLLAAAPIERLGVYSATWEQWQEFAASLWLPRIREIDFDGIGTPIEAMRELRTAPGASGLRALRFRSCLGRGMPEVLNQLFQSPLGDRLETLELAQAFAAEEGYFEDLSEAFQQGGNFKSLRLQSMAFGRNHLHRFFTSRSWKLEELSLADEVGSPDVDYFGYPDCWPELHTVRFDGVNLDFANPNRLADSLLPPKLKVLELANSSLHPEAVRELCKADHLARLRVVRLRRMSIDNRGLRYITEARFWKNLVELDLRGNPIDENGVKHLLKRRPPPELELLRVDPRFTEEVHDALREHFGGKVEFGVPER